jgi:methyl-accepting chemotaxis protein
VTQAMTQLDSVIQQNASASEELASSSEELSSQAMALKEAVAFFTIAERADRADRAEGRTSVRKPVAAPAPARAAVKARKLAGPPRKSASRAIAIKDAGGDDDFEAF